jgi:murein L,D-transpeptidase YcbB/YkuD
VCDPRRQNPDYLRLCLALSKYRKMATLGGWSKVPTGPTLIKGDDDDRVASARRRLQQTGELKEASSSTEFDSTLETAVQRFQKNHGLDPSGTLNRRTVAEMNVPVEARIGTLQVNIERWRQLPIDLGWRYVLVDIPSFEVRAYADRQRVLLLRAIIGGRRMQTPMLASQITNIILNPFWFVPRKMAIREALPEIRQDPKGLKEDHVDVFEKLKGRLVRVDPEKIDWSKVNEKNFSYWLRQAPGPDNPLGSVKFSFDNRFLVYLHGTPDTGLFDATSRVVSHGCVRIEKPLELASTLLKWDEAKWNEEKLKAELKTGKPRTISLRRPIPVYLAYWTARVDENLDVQFRPDVYHWDRPELLRPLPSTASKPIAE